MKTLLAVLLSLVLWVPVASADDDGDLAPPPPTVAAPAR